MIFSSWKRELGGELRALDTIISQIVRLLMPAQSKCLAEKLQCACSVYRSACRPLIPQVLIAALIVAEDHRFYIHGGIDLVAILRAMWHSIYHGRLTGGSTIEQQLVRTLTGNKERNLRRKIKELALSFRVSECVPKSDVPGLYMSVAYFGWRMNGICEAYARMGISGLAMTPRQAAEIVARLKYPEPNCPNALRTLKIRKRVAYILDRLNSLSAGLSPQYLRLRDYEALFSDR